MRVRFNHTSILIIISCLLAMFTEIVFNHMEGYELMPLIPFVYALAIVFSGACNRLFSFDTPGMSIVNGLYYIKSVIYTLFQAISGKTNNSFVSTSITENRMAIVFCIIEIIVIYFFYWLFSRNTQIINDFNYESSIDIHSTSFGQNIILFIFFFIVIGLIIRSPSVLYRYNFFTISSVSTINENANNIIASGFTSVMVELAKSLLPVVICTWAFKKNNESEKTIYIYISMILLCVLSMVVTGVSRSSFVVTGLSSCFLLIRVFPQKRDVIKRIFGTVLVVVFFVFSLTKFSDFLGYRLGVMEKTNNISNTLQVYFCGIHNNAVAIRTRSLFESQIGINTLLSDLFDNWMGIGALFRNSTNITEYFNQAMHTSVLSYDQIVPTIGQGYIQFGFIGIYFYTIIMVYIINKFDRLSLKSQRIEFYYLYILISIKCSVTLMGNFKIFMASVLNVFVPLFIIFTINKIITAKKESIVHN